MCVYIYIYIKFKSINQGVVGVGWVCAVPTTSSRERLSPSWRAFRPHRLWWVPRTGSHSCSCYRSMYLAVILCLCCLFMYVYWLFYVALFCCLFVQVVMVEVVIPESMKKHSFCTSPCPATQRQQLQSSSWFGDLKASIPMSSLLLSRGVFFSDTGSSFTLRFVSLWWESFPGTSYNLCNLFVPVSAVCCSLCILYICSCSFKLYICSRLTTQPAQKRNFLPFFQPTSDDDEELLVWWVSSKRSLPSNPQLYCNTTCYITSTSTTT